MSLQDKKFKLDDRVIITKTNSPLDGEMGTILGKAIDHICDFYIVLLDKQCEDHKAVLMPESCIDKINI